MLGSIVCSDTTFRTRTRAMSRLGALCGVFGVLLVSWGGFFQGCLPRACTTDANCDTGLVCDTASGDCEECLTDADCAAIEEAREQAARGEVKTLEEARRELGL